MAIYQPTAVIGNSRLLVTLGGKGELMGLFYPRVDFPQNLREGMPAVYFFGEGSEGYLSWTFEPAWRARQHYLDRANVVETELHHGPTGLTLRLTDLVVPERAGVVRHFEATNQGSRVLRGKLFQYLAFQLGESPLKNAIHVHAEEEAGAVYWRHLTFALGSDGMDDFTCGRATEGSHNSAKRQMEEGTLWRLEDEIGAVDFAAGWNLSLEPGERDAHTFVLAADENETGALEVLRELVGEGWGPILERVKATDREHLKQATAPALAPDLTEAYDRCLLTLDLMIDPDLGSMIAAPEFDPEYRRSGGYGYCWPRDAAEVSLSLAAAGYPHYLAKFLDWAVRCQRPEGYWEQRFWLTGDRAPSWCTREERLQTDQTAAVLFAMGQHGRSLAGRQRAAFLERTWPAAQRGGGGPGAHGLDANGAARPRLRSLGNVSGELHLYECGRFLRAAGGRLPGASGRGGRAFGHLGRARRRGAGGGLHAPAGEVISSPAAWTWTAGWIPRPTPPCWV